MKKKTDFVPQRPQKILHRPSVVFPKLAQILNEHLVQSRVPIVPDDVDRISFECNEIGITRIPAHDLESIGCVLQERQSPGRVPEVWMHKASGRIRSVER